MSEQKPPRRAYIYARVDSSQEPTATLGLDAQVQACRAYIERHGLREVRVTTEVVPPIPRWDRRTNLEEVVVLLEPGDVLVAYDWDTLTRRGIHEAWRIRELVAGAGASLEFVAE